MKGTYLGLGEALGLTLEKTGPLSAENVALLDSVDRIAAADLDALVDSPSMDVSRKDGYALSCCEVAGATAESPVRLRLLGSMAAGEERVVQVRPGTTVRVLTGARIPVGADAVVAEEFVKKEGHDVLVRGFAEPKNILARGSDVALGARILGKGRRISPAMAGLLAAAGHSVVPVYRNPVVGIIGTGDEIVEPGRPLADGKVYASNVVTLAGWCRKYRMVPRIAIVEDDRKDISDAVTMMARETDAVITSGGAWVGDRDMVVQVLEGLGWQQVFHRVRMGPGKAIGFGVLDTKPVFVLPGGPPSNLMGFLQIALPGLLALGGHTSPGLPEIHARLAVELGEGQADWTDFFFGTVEFGEGLPVFHPMEKRSRLGRIAEATAVVAIPEGRDHLPEGSILPLQLLW